ncbi:ATP-grasp fold amidoligase family protein [Gelatiniphilus marinus]|uniref:ATP-grasp fold amidoligase family protein n=1 Tax=Gelatiniphilus marinus TaxID=1759464 RepID=A0ABW5JMS5_9FLAO
MKKYLWQHTKALLSKTSPELYVKNRFKANLGYSPNFKNPKTHNEHMAKRRFSYTEQMTLLSDKIAVRDYVAKKIGDKYLVPLLFEMDSLSETIYNKLPNSFVIKANHGSGFNLLVKNKLDYSFEKLKQITNNWLETKYHLLGMELHYKNIKPRLLVEELLLDEEGKVPKDYKFYCFESKKYLGVYVDRFVDTRVAFFDEKWEPADYPFIFKEVDDPREVKKPENFDEMITVVSKLSQPFDYVRLDLYSVNNRIYFGEFTFTPGGGIDKFKTYEKDLEWGQLWNKN